MNVKSTYTETITIIVKSKEEYTKELARLGEENYNIVSSGISKYKGPMRKGFRGHPCEWTIRAEKHNDNLRDLKLKEIGLVALLNKAQTRLQHDAVGDFDPGYSAKIANEIEKILTG